MDELEPVPITKLGVRAEDQLYTCKGCGYTHVLSFGAIAELEFRPNIEDFVMKAFVGIEVPCHKCGEIIRQSMDMSTEEL